MIISVRVGKNQKMTIGNNVKSPQTKKHTKKLLHVHVRVHVQYNVIRRYHAHHKKLSYEGKKLHVLLYCTCSCTFVVYTYCTLYT